MNMASYQTSRRPVSHPNNTESRKVIDEERLERGTASSIILYSRPSVCVAACWPYFACFLANFERQAVLGGQIGDAGVEYQLGQGFQPCLACATELCVCVCERVCSSSGPHRKRRDTERS